MARVREGIGPLPGLDKLVIHDHRPQRYGSRGTTRDQGFDPRGYSERQLAEARRAQSRPGPGGETPYYMPADPGSVDEPYRPLPALSAEEVAERNRRDWQQSQNVPLIDPGRDRRQAMALGADLQRQYDAHWAKDATGGRLMRHVVDLDPAEGNEGTYQGQNEEGQHHELRRRGEGFELWREEPGAALQSIDARRQSSDCRCSDRQREVDKLAQVKRDLAAHWSGRVL